jgi:WD40 repeat protein
LGEGTEDTRRRITRAELDTDTATAEVIDGLAAARLIMLGTDTIEIAHEALISGWPALREWLTADREKLRAHRRLTDAAAEWARHGRDEGHLYHGSMLATWQNHDPDTLNDLERTFLHASVAREKHARTTRQRRLRAALVGAVAIVVVIGMLAVLAMFQADQASEERDLALSRQLATNARAQLQLDPELAMLLGIEAMKIKPTTEADAVLRQAIVDSRALATLPMASGKIPMSVAISQDGRRVAATAGYELRVFEQSKPGASWKTRMVLPGYDHVAFSRDGRYLASVSGSTVHVLDLDRGGDPILLLGGRTTIMDVTFSPDGRLLAAAVDGGVRLWDLTGRRPPTLLEIHDNGPMGIAGADTVAFSSDGRYLTSSGRVDRNVRIWDLSGQQPVVVFHPPAPVLAFSPDSTSLALGCGAGNTQIVDPRSIHPPVSLHTNKGSAALATFSPDGRKLACGGLNGTIQIIDINNTSEAEPLLLLGHQGTVQGMAFSRDGRRLASVGSDGTLRLWSTAGPGNPVTLDSHGGPAQTATFTPDGTRVVTGGRDITVQNWRANNSEPVVFRQHNDTIRDVDVSRDGRWIASISKDGVVLVRNAATGTVYRELHLPASSNVGNGNFVAFSPDGHYLATNSNNGMFLIWDLSSGNFTLHGTYLILGYSQAEFSPNGKQVVAAASDGTVQLWPTQGIAPIVLHGHQGGINGVAFSPDGHRVASGGNDGTIRIWSTNGHGQPTILHGHQGIVSSVAFSPNGQYLAATGPDGTLQIWNTTTNSEPVVYHDYQPTITSATFSLDGRHLLTTHTNGTVQIQQCEICTTTQQILALAKARTTRHLTTAERRTFGLPEPYTRIVTPRT